MKKILIGLLVLCGVYLIMCFIGPKKLDVTVSRTMPSPIDKVYSQVIDLKKWEGWSPWLEKDASIVTRYYNETEGRGARSTWTSKKDGGGSLEIIKTLKHKYINLLTHFNDYDVDNNVTFTFESLGPQKTKVDWRMEGRVDYPFLSRGMMMFTSFDKEIKKDYKRGLELLNAKAQQGIHVFPTNSGNFEVQIIGIEGRTIVGKRKKIKRSELVAFYNEMKANLYPILSANQLVPVGMPWAAIYEQDKDNIDLLLGFPVNKKVTSISGADVFSFDNTQALTLNYNGEYGDLLSAHQAIQDYANEKGLVYQKPVLEQFVSNNLDGNRTNPQLLTRLYALKK